MERDFLEFGACFELLSEESNSVIVSLIFIAKLFLDSPDVSTDRTVLKPDVAGIEEQLVILIKYFNISFNIFASLDKQLIYNLSMFQFEMQFLGVFADYCYVCFLLGWEEKTFCLVVYWTQLVGCGGVFVGWAGDTGVYLVVDLLVVYEEMGIWLGPGVAASDGDPDKFGRGSHEEGGFLISDGGAEMFVYSEWYFGVDKLISIKGDCDVLIHNDNGFEPDGSANAIVF